MCVYCLYLVHCELLGHHPPRPLRQVVAYLQHVPCYAEPAAAVPGGSAAVRQGGRLWTLRAPRRPERRLPELQLPAGCEGRLLDGPQHLVSWTVPHSGWQQALLFLDDLQQEVRQGRAVRLWGLAGTRGD